MFVPQVVLKALDPVFEIDNPYAPNIQGETMDSYNTIKHTDYISVNENFIEKFVF